MSVVRLATRKSALALAQSAQFAARLRAANPGVEVELVQVVTEGDRVQDRSLATIGGKGLFVKEIEAALLEGRADIAVHSMKDLPGVLPAGLCIACVPSRADPWDALLTPGGAALDALPRSARLGTSSQRRAMQLLRVRPDLRVGLLRGNIDTRVRRLEEGSFDAIVLAEAGIQRLGIDPPRCSLRGVIVPAVAQGALAIEARGDDDRVSVLLRPLHDPRAALEVEAERATMTALQGNCVTPLGVHARWEPGAALALEGFLASDDGAVAVTARHSVGCGGALDEARAAGRSLAAQLRDGLSAAS